MHPEFSDEDIMALFEEKRTHEDIDKWIVCFDGASNALGHGVGAVLVSPDDQCIPFTARLGFDCTNNMAEYEACALGVQAAIDFDVKLLKVYGDSALVIHQLKEEWETRDPKLIPYQTHILRLAKYFDDISFHHIPREENQMADALATLASMFQLAPHGDLPYIEFKSQGRPAYCYAIEEERDWKPWYFDIKQYVENKEYPPGISDNDKRTLRRLATGFFVSGTILYKRNHDMTLLRCVDAKEANFMIEEIHEGSFGAHANGHAMARKILRAGYYWLTMESDCCAHVRKCHKCQAYADNVNVPPHPLKVMSAPWPFSMWGIDVIGAIEPKASNGHRFILVAIDYFTKWVEAASYTNAQARYDQLNLIEGKRLTAMSHGRLYQRRVKNAFDKKVRPRKFNEGDLVLKKMSHTVKDSRGKWAPNYEGPFVVKRAFSGGALILTNMDDEELPSPVNSDVVKRYYAWSLGQSRGPLHGQGLLRSRYIGTDASGDRVTTDRSLPLPGAKQAENVAARQPSSSGKTLTHKEGGDMEMAPRKLASKRSRKDKAAEGTSSAPEYDSHRFRSA
ncbi:Ribonuclease HI [Glycine max]|nr:Ribonuclease HI [Glycine max]